MLSRRTPKPAEPVCTSAGIQATVPDQLLGARAVLLFSISHQRRVLGPVTLVMRLLSVMLSDCNSEELKKTKIYIFTSYNVV